MVDAFVQGWDVPCEGGDRHHVLLREPQSGPLRLDTSDHRVLQGRMSLQAPRSACRDLLVFVDRLPDLRWDDATARLDAAATDPVAARAFHDRIEPWLQAGVRSHRVLVQVADRDLDPATVVAAVERWHLHQGDGPTIACDLVAAGRLAEVAALQHAVPGAAPDDVARAVARGDGEAELRDHLAAQRLRR